MSSETNHIPLLIFAGAMLAVVGAQSQAQSALFRSVGPDGRVTYSDRAPVEARADVRTVVGAVRAPAPTTAVLPHELREAVSRFPVMLYTAKGCAPCADARRLLAARGVPFAERTVTSLADAAAFKALSGDQTLPFATVGSQHLKGFSDVEWKHWLDVAGYPAQSRLPHDWRPSEPTPLVTVAKIAAPGAAAETAIATRSAPLVVAPDNPAGIRF